MRQCVVDKAVECVGPTDNKRWTCPVHGVRMTVGWVELCRNKPAYREAWIEGVGVGQSNPDGKRRSTSTRPLKDGPGTELHKILAKCGINPTETCQCRSRIKKMNKWGPEKCREEIETIVCWMEEEARKRTKIPIPFTRVIAKRLALRAIRTWERKTK